MRTFSLRAYGRILWREAAEQYTFCIGIFAMLVVMQASLTTMDAFNMIQSPTVAFGFGMALFMTAIYTTASSALLFTAEVRPEHPSTSRDGLVEYTADGVVLLRYHERDDGDVQLSLRVIKMRGCRHERTVRPYDIEANGIAVHAGAQVF